jgi:LacI family gluconate utilization system Gnt-I transcriptional repressor
MAGFNGVELLDGLPLQLATMDACRKEVGRIAAQIIADRVINGTENVEKVVELSPKLNLGSTLRDPQ